NVRRLGKPYHNGAFTPLYNAVMLPRPAGVRSASDRASAWIFWAAVWLGAGMSVAKAAHFVPTQGVDVRGTPHFIPSLSAITFAAVVFALTVWAGGRAALIVLRRLRVPPPAITAAVTVSFAICLLYAVINIVIFGLLGGFLTYPLLSLVGDVRMMRSSVGA